MYTHPEMFSHNHEETKKGYMYIIETNPITLIL